VTVRKALILAAGSGSRLGRLTQNIPKPMLRVHNQPVLETHVRRLAAAGVWNIWINLHHAPAAIRDYFGDGSRFGVSIHYSEEERLLGTAGALHKLASEFCSGLFFVVYGDNYIELDYAALGAGRRGLATILVHHRGYVAESGVVEVAADNRILNFQEKPAPGEERSHWVNAGVYVCQPAMLDYLPPGESDFARDIFPAMLRDGCELYAAISPVPVGPLDTPEMLAATDPLWVAQIGAGKIGARRAALFPKVAAVADIDVDRARAVAAPCGARAVSRWEEAVDDERVRIVSVATTNDLLVPVAQRAIERGRHVLVEKPCALCSRDLEPLARLAQERGLVYQAGFNYRFHPAMERAKSLLREGAIGRLLHGSARHGHGGRLGLEKEWRSRPEVSGGGELLDQGVHLIDLVRWFSGDEVAGVEAALRTDFWPIQPLEDHALAWLDLRGGARFSLEVSLTQWKNLFTFELVGERGAIVIEGLGGSYGPERLTLIRRPERFGAPAIEMETFDDPDRCWLAQWEAMERAIRCGETPNGSVSDSLACLRVIEACHQSSDERRMVKMKRRAVFLDRDGVLVRAAPVKEYAHGPLTLADFSIFPDVAEPVTRLHDAGFLIVLATNQPGIARGQMSRETLNAMHGFLRAAVPLDAIEVCPHADADACACRKPKPGMLLAVADRLDIDLTASYFIGDTARDVGAALAASVTPILIDWPYNRDLDVRYRVKDLAEAAELILLSPRRS
jgi:histidinol-phosphate phosphatase family protein